MFATSAGELSTGEPSRPDLAHFVILPDTFEPNMLKRACGRNDPGSTTVPRPYSSHSPRIDLPTAGSGCRPHTALPSSGQQGAAAPVPLFVRVLHAQTKTFLHTDAATGQIFLKASTTDSPAGSLAANGDQQSDDSTRRNGSLFEILSCNERDALRAISGHDVPSIRTVSTVSSRQAVAAVSSGRNPCALPVRGFDMATGTVRAHQDDYLSSLLESATNFARERPASTLVSSTPNMKHPDGPVASCGNTEPCQDQATSFAECKRASNDDSKTTSWEPSQLDLSDVISQGPLQIRNLFNCVALPGSTLSSMEGCRRLERSRLRTPAPALPLLPVEATDMMSAVRSASCAVSASEDSSRPTRGRGRDAPRFQMLPSSQSHRM